MVLELSGVSVSYGSAVAVEGVDLQVRAGEVLALVGANGAGKTTLLRTVSGLLRPRAGLVRLDGSTLTGLPPPAVVARGVAHVPEGRRVFGRLTVHENLQVGGHLERDTRVLDARLARVLALFPVLAERAGQPAGTIPNARSRCGRGANTMLARRPVGCSASLGVRATESPSPCRSSSPRTP